MLLDEGTVQSLAKTISDIVRAPTAIVSISNRILATATQDEATFKLPIQRASHHVIAIRYDSIEVGAVVVERQLKPGDLENKTVRGFFHRQRLKSPEPSHLPQDEDAMMRKRVETLLAYTMPLGVRAKAANILHTGHADQTLRKLSENHQALRQDYDRLIEADRIRNAIMSRVSHELRTPLTSILGYSELLLSNHPHPLTPQQQEYVKTIQTKGEELFEHLTRLLDYSEIENEGQITVANERVMVSRIFSKLRKVYAPKAAAKDVKMVFDLREANLALNTDESKLFQVLSILLDNAVKYTRQRGEVTLSSVRVERSSGMRMIEFSVNDTGIGIAQEHLEKVFDAFYHTGESKHTSASSGIGLGLSVAKKLIEALGASVKIESKLGWGTKVVVAFHANES